MATKTQKDFKKQIKELEKDGKLNHTYYAKRRIATGSGISIAAILFVLWYSGALNFILSLVMGLFSGGAGGNISYEAYRSQMQIVDGFVSEAYTEIYAHYFEDGEVSKESLEDRLVKLDAYKDMLKTETAELKPVADAYAGKLEAAETMLTFSINHYGESLSEADRLYLENIAKKALTQIQ